MKRVFFIMILQILGLPLAVHAEQAAVSEAQLQAVITSQTAQGLDAYLAAEDKFGTPLVIKLARQGDMEALTQLGTRAASGKFLLVKDPYGNTIFHVVKDAQTLQTLAALIRQHYATNLVETIHELADARNHADETPLHAQINAGHTDTFRLLYKYMTLREENASVRNQLNRLRGMDPRIVRTNQAIYCREIKKLGSGHGQTILEAAQAQALQRPDMARLAGHIQNRLPCLAL